MLNNEHGDVMENERAIFPLVTFNRSRQTFRCIGTAFFIHESGWFVTAKHVLYDNCNNMHEMIMGTHGLSSGSLVTRLVTHLSVHPNADIAIGRLGEARDGKANIVAGEPVAHFFLSFKALMQGDEILTFGYPRTTSFDVGTETTFEFGGRWSQGKIEEYHPGGAYIVCNRCYQTSMYIDTGVSGGPVFHENLVVGVNSSGWDFVDGDTPLSFITPVDYLLDLNVHVTDDAFVPFKQLIEEGMIRVR